MKQTIAFQGEAGAFSEEAACLLFGDMETRGYENFDDMVEAVDRGDVEFGLLPCENSIHGSIARSYDLLLAHPRIRIVDETTHRIVQALIGTSDATLDRITCVRSHPVALEQCRVFLARRPQIEIQVVADTAGAVRAIAQQGDPTQAAIGPARSADRYGARVLVESVADEAENYTRFFAVQRDGTARRSIGRACIAAVLAHRPGSLHGALGEIHREGWNLRSLVTRPRRGNPFEYVFYLEFDCPSQRVAEQLAGRLSGESRVLGWY
ncbi:MAG: prephenate dehydratase [Vulcanimicrobiaceae bacterium]